MTVYDYIHDGNAIYERSFAIIRAEADLQRFSEEEADVAVRMIHACGVVEAAQHFVFSVDFVSAARGALLAGTPILCDAEMVARGVTVARLPAKNEVVCTLRDPQTAEIAKKIGNTRSAAALELWRDKLGNALVAIGNAPTALFYLLEMIEKGAPKPAAIIGMPVGFVGAAEFEGSARRKQARHSLRDRARTHGRQRHDRGRRQRSSEARPLNMNAKTGRLIGVGTGPGDPELLTLKAVHALQEADVVAYFAKRGSNGNARAIVGPHYLETWIELPLIYPVTTEIDKDSKDYREAILGFYEESVHKVEKHLENGKTVAVLSEGDPLFYGSYMHLHVRLSDRWPTEVIPGVTAMSGCWSQTGTPIVQGDDILTVLPGTLSEFELTRRLADTDAAVIMKVGRNLPKIRKALAAAGLLDRAIYVERGTMANTRSERLADKADNEAPYFSIVLVPGWADKP